MTFSEILEGFCPSTLSPVKEWVLAAEFYGGGLQQGVV